ncbi:MAG: AmmeMemoRadiSam system protein A [Desulfobacterales bacterium]|nr:AmmeMemoRadiSam system protein A [Desulfobacterales bacterium]
MNTPTYNAAQRRRILRIAREGMAEALAGGQREVDAGEDEGYLTESRGCFVTLHTRGGDLRGCIGTFAADGPLVETLVKMAGAVTRDPRFVTQPVTLAELDRLVIEVSVLTPLQPIDDPLGMRVGVDGIYITADRMGSRVSGCFLPHVATEMGWDAEMMLSMCCAHKMGLDADAWREPGDMTFSVFQTEIIEEGVE